MVQLNRKHCEDLKKIFIWFKENNVDPEKIKTYAYMFRLAERFRREDDIFNLYKWVIEDIEDDKLGYWCRRQNEIVKRRIQKQKKNAPEPFFQKKHTGSNPHDPKSSIMLGGVGGENKGNQQMQDLERICSTLPKEDIQKALDILNKRNMDPNAINLIDDTEEANDPEAASGSSSKRKADEPKQTPESSKRQKTSTPEKYSVEYFTEWEKEDKPRKAWREFGQFRIWKFIDKGPNFVFDLFDKDIKLHNWFKNLSEPENMRFRETFFFYVQQIYAYWVSPRKATLFRGRRAKKFMKEPATLAKIINLKGKQKKIRRQWIKDNIKEWDLQSLKRLVEKYGFQYMDEHLSNFDLVCHPSKHVMEFAKETLSLDLRKAIVSGKKSKFHSRGKCYVNSLLRDEYEIKGNFTKKEQLELLTDLLNIPRRLASMTQ